jgi:hypothetical protein
MPDSVNPTGSSPSDPDQTAIKWGNKEVNWKMPESAAAAGWDQKDYNKYCQQTLMMILQQNQGMFNKALEEQKKADKKLITGEDSDD